MNLSVVIPVHNGGDNLGVCLEALSNSVRPADEIIVVDDASTDGSGDLAQEHGAHVLRLPGPPQGAARPRNRGAGIASGDLIVFVDSDVAVHPDALALAERTMSEHQEIVALFGSYDAHPRAPGLVTRYKNLQHHYVHHHSQREASTFWTGLGAIRSSVLHSVGGFNESYPHIEDIELGTRLRRAGYRIWLCPEVQGTHLKRWTLGSLLRSDIFDRAVLWSRLILKDARLPGELNLDSRSRWSAFAMWLAVVLLLIAWRWAWAGAGALLCLVAVGALNADLYRFFWRQGGASFGIAAPGLHSFYLLYSSLVFVLVAGQTVLSRLPLPGRRRG